MSTYWDVDFVEHAYTLPCVYERDVLGRRNNHGSCKSARSMTFGLTIHYNELTQTELHVARSWRHVDDQNIQVFAVRRPVHIEEELGSA